MSEGKLACVLRSLVAGGTLSPEDCRAAMGEMLSGAATHAQIGAFLAVLGARGAKVDEIAGLVQGMRAHAIAVRPSREGLIDLCGTGGDGSGIVNISTAASLVVAACGVPVAKHGNRSASSLCGSADVLEELGVPIDLGPEAAARSIDELGFAFLFARTYHPAMRHVAPVRAELGIRTVFNILGPLTNPAGVRRQLLGVYADELRDVIARVLAEVGSESVWVVHGEGGLDELSISGPSRVTRLVEGEVIEDEIVPEDAGLSRHPVEELRGGDARANARILSRMLAGEEEAVHDAVLLNAAAALVVHGTAGDLREGAERARDAIGSGRVEKLLEGLRSFR
ncbi:MAG TPA: anthranilate phosphoribosyltransferase [Planctomycetota bacterium]|nr:anthranilate phosphoribosyltransferase [Planctomycetota bacterium]